MKSRAIRESDRYVSVGFRLETEGAKTVPGYRFEVYNARAPERLVCEVSLGGTDATGTSWHGSTSRGLVLPRAKRSGCGW